jgi:type I restriction enzyme R subunit
VQTKEQALLAEIIERVNGLFEGELTDDDQLVYVNGVLKGKLLENETLMQQARRPPAFSSGAVWNPALL